jgi:UDP-N-acetylglucosamine--N-acetylmuramyl-(pentapeptide) pyrophosphoryl-undecaprenol N-acetylglucosamine transferase
MAESGAALVIEEPELSAESFVREISALTCDSGRLEKMAAAAKALGKPEAGRRLAKIITEMAKK